MNREQFFEWLRTYEGTYIFKEDDYGEVTIKFFVNEINEDDKEIKNGNTKRSIRNETSC